MSLLERLRAEIAQTGPMSVADYMTRWQDLYVKDGFKRLQQDGAWFQNCHYPYAYTVTAAGCEWFEARSWSRQIPPSPTGGARSSRRQRNTTFPRFISNVSLCPTAA